MPVLRKSISLSPAIRLYEGDLKGRRPEDTVPPLPLVMTPGRLLYLLQFNCARGWRAAWYDYLVAPKIRDYQLPARLAPAPPVPVHIVTSKDDWLRAAWTLASWHHVTQRKWEVVIHGDGTLPPTGINLLTELFPHARLVTRTEADEKMNRVLAPYRRCREYRDQLPLGLKIFDVPHFCQAQRFLLLDSDVLFFRYPKEMIDWAEAHDDRRCLFNADVEDASPLPTGEARRQLKVNLLPRINSGLCLLWRDALDLPFCEMALRDTSLGKAKPWRIEQTLFALNTCRESRAALLPPTYEVSLKAHARRDAIARHYVGAVRRHFYDDGIQMLQPDLLGSP